MKDGSELISYRRSPYFGRSLLFCMAFLRKENVVCQDDCEFSWYVRDFCTHGIVKFDSTPLERLERLETLHQLLETYMWLAQKRKH
mmetsp:Transcript_10993/g.20322  ORF Transcript_10993/g.20322 Transcript_10993/m.20322 type:complete len:86 (+) Transcript_10993:790-1047(+)